MIITIIQGKDGMPVVSVQGETGDTPESVVKAYREAEKVHEKEDSK